MLKAVNKDDAKYDRKHIVKTAPQCLRKIKAAIQMGEIQTFHEIEITPDMARAILTLNRANRPKSAATAKRYAKAMGAGRWAYTRTPIVFSKSGDLLDGQHRLYGCVMSGAAIVVDLAFGAPDESFAYIDIGKRRGGGDIFSIHGVPNAFMMASAINWVVAYDDNAMGVRGPTHHIEIAELYERFEDHPDLQRSAHAGRAFEKSKIAPPSMACALHYICARKNRQVADEFFEQVAEGAGLAKGSPGLALRNVLLDNAMRVGGERMSSRRMAGIILRAWNNLRGDKTVKALRYRETEPFPRAR